MCNNLKDNLDLFITERIQESIKSLRSANEEYNDLCKHHAENSNKYQDIINSLNKENKEFIESFKNDIYIIEEKTQDWLYLQGYKDCINLLKLLEAI